VAFYREHILVTWGGHSGGGDIWQCGWRFATAGLTTLVWPAGGFLLGPIYDALVTAFGGSLISNGACLEWVKVAQVKPDGNYARDPQDYLGEQTFGNISTLVSGPQDSMCVSLWSGSSIGKGNHGRFYLPWSGANVDRTTGRYVASLLPPILARWRTAVVATTDRLNTDLGAAGPVQLVIMGSSTAKKVTQLKIGDVMDTQRRRRNALNEMYQSIAL
jgi:hypothetical protein